MKKAAIGAFALMLMGLFACEDQPCSRYVDYVCQCHPNDPELSCDDLGNALIGGDVEVQDECSLLLRDLQAEDDAAGLACDTI